MSRTMATVSGDFLFLGGAPMSRAFFVARGKAMETATGRPVLLQRLYVQVFRFESKGGNYRFRTVLSLFYSGTTVHLTSQQLQQALITPP